MQLDLSKVIIYFITMKFLLLFIFYEASGCQPDEFIFKIVKKSFCSVFTSQIKISDFKIQVSKGGGYP